MPSGSRNKRGNRGRGHGGHNGGSKPNTKAARVNDNRPTSTTTNVEPVLKQATKRMSNYPTNAHHVNEEEEIAASVCWICAEPIKYYALSTCNHRTCHVCALRLRALYEKIECTFCKEPQSTVVFTTSSNTDFSSYALDVIPYKDTKLAIFFETPEIMEETLTLLRFNCPSSECDYTASGWGHLKLHTRVAHEKVFCDLCIRSKKVFPHEHALYPPDVLPLHLPSMPHRPRQQPANETIECGIHPLCKFCNECFFGDDELFMHMREQHEECFLCKRNEVRYQYFQNYNSLELHFLQAHFACTDSICQAQKFVVFDSELDLNAHRLDVHGANMSPKERKEARRVRAGSHSLGSCGRRGGQDSADPERPRGPIPHFVWTQGSSPGREAAEGVPLTGGMRVMQYAPPNGRAACVKSLVNESSAHAMISAVWNAVDQNLQSTAKIVNAVIDFLEGGEKRHDILVAWDDFEIELQSCDLDHTGTESSYTRFVVDDVLRATAPRYSQQSPQLDRAEHHVMQPASPTSISSPTFSSSSDPIFTSSDAAQLEAFPSLVRPRANSKVVPPQPQQSKSWASVAALLTLPPPVPAPRWGDAARQPLLSSDTQGCSLLPVAGPSPGSSATPFYYPYYYPLQSPHSWGSLADTDLSAWTPSWSAAGGGTATSGAVAGEGTKGKGKQRQRFASGSFSF